MKYTDIDRLMKDGIKKYGSKNEFLCSTEYREIYPQIKKVCDEEASRKHSDIQNEAEKAMTETNIKPGDRVEYTVISFMSAETYTGTVVMRKGIPYVKYDAGIKDIKGNKSQRWNKGWRKV